MSGILHLLSPRSAGDEGALACAASIAATPEHQHRVLIVGDSAAERRAWALGVRSTDRVVPLLGRASGCTRRAGAWLRAMSAAGYAPRVVQSWCAETAVLAERVGGLPEGVQRSAAILRMPSERGSQLLWQWCDRTRLCVFGSDMRRALGELRERASGRSGRFEPRVRVLDPRIEDAAKPITDRGRIRTAMGVQEQDPLVALVSHDPARASAMAFAFALGLLKAAGVRAIGWAPRDVHDLRRAARFVRAHSRTWGLVSGDPTLPELLSAADVAVYDDGGLNVSPGPWLVSIAAESGARLVVPRGAATGGGDFVVCERTPASVVNAVMRALSDGASRAGRGESDRASSGDHTIGKLWAEMLNLPQVDGSRPGVLTESLA